MRDPQIGFPQLVQDFFLQRLITQRGASARTVESYRDAFELLFGHIEKHTGTSPSALQMADLDAPLVLDFLDYLESDRGNSARTRNARLAAIHCLTHLRSTKSPGRPVNGPGIVVRGPFRREIPRNPSRRISRSTVQRATGWPSRYRWSCRGGGRRRSRPSAPSRAACPRGRRAVDRSWCTRPGGHHRHRSLIQLRRLLLQCWHCSQPFR